MKTNIMENYSKLVDERIIDYLDYLSIFQLKYVNQYIYNQIKNKSLDKTLDLRNIKYESKFTYFR
jgi:hypothetical protein